MRIARELVDGYADPVGGALVPLEASGHGLRLRREVAERYRVG